MLIYRFVSWPSAVYSGTLFRRHTQFTRMLSKVQCQKEVSTQNQKRERGGRFNLRRTILYDHCCEGRVVLNGQSSVHRLYVRTENYANQVREIGGLKRQTECRSRGTFQNRPVTPLCSSNDSPLGYMILPGEADWNARKPEGFIMINPASTVASQRTDEDCISSWIAIFDNGQ